MKVTLGQQIDWAGDQVRHMQRQFPKLLEAEKITPEFAEHRLSCAIATLKTLIQLKRLIGAKETPPCQS